MTPIRRVLSRALDERALLRLTRVRDALVRWVDPADPTIGLGLTRLW
ncbi:MAG: hypothetical protein KJZ74_15075 [Gemmatimonadales bacterium]|nr:hypothetical protein [Gemmatimonadota bacterium]MCL4215226.1 hypothetical protein [Gemmatimonadales bacterium]